MAVRPPSLNIYDDRAVGFYLRMGAARVGEISYPIDGQRRTLPLLVVEVRNRRTA